MASKAIHSGQLFTRTNPTATASTTNLFVLTLVNNSCITIKDGGSFADTYLQSRTPTMKNGGPRRASTKIKTKKKHGNPRDLPVEL